MKTFIKIHYQKVRTLYKKYERLLMPATLVGGFLVDYFTFTSIQISITFTLLFGYWIIVGATIAFTHLYDAPSFAKASEGKWQIWHKFLYLRLFSPLIIQFCFGSLLGSSLIFYWFSGAFSISWPIMLILVLLMVFNETFRHYFDKPLVHIGVYFFATLSLFSALLPFLFSSLSAWFFISACAVILAIFVVYIYYLCRFAKSRSPGDRGSSMKSGHLLPQRRQFFMVIVAITAAMNVLYFTNIIPPIPLALREAGLYHSIKVSGEKYTMAVEPEHFLKTAIFGQTLNLAKGDRAYLYTAIFAPARLKTTMVHRWQYYDKEQKEWVDKGKLLFTINGGREDGDKGYSGQNDLSEGKWRI